jgi:formate/nitrite transporter
MLRVLALVFFSNMIGAMLATLIVFYSGQYDYSEGLLGAYVIKIALSKSTISFGTAFCSGIMCNVFVCGAVIMASTAREAGGKIWAMFFPIMVFVVSGFEHCVANMSYIPAGILAKSDAKYATVAMEQYGITAEQLAQISWKAFFVDNLIPVTIGNIVGGMGLGIVLYLAYEKLPKLRTKYR